MKKTNDRVDQEGYLSNAYIIPTVPSVLTYLPMIYKTSLSTFK